MSEQTKDIQSEIKDTNVDNKIDKFELLDWLSKLEPKDIAESLNSPDKKNEISNLIKTPVEEAIKDLEWKNFEELSIDQKDLLVLSSRLSWNNQESFNALIKQDNSLDQTMYESIVQTELNRLYPAKQDEVVNSVEDLEISSMDWLKLYWGRNWAPSPDPKDIVNAVNKITDVDKKTKIKTLISESAKSYKDWDFDWWKNKVIELQTYLIEDCDCTLYWKNGGKDWMFGMWTYNAIFNLWISDEKDKKDPMLSEYIPIDNTEEKKDDIDSPELDAYWNEMISISDISQLPLDKREDKKMYVIVNNNIKYFFYWNGRVHDKTNKNTYNRADLIEKNKNNNWWKRKWEVLQDEYMIISKEMGAHFKRTFHSNSSVLYFNDTKTFSINVSSGIERYKDSISIDLKDNKISYLWESISFPSKITYQEIFEIAANSYKLINKRADSHWSFAYNYPTWLHFNFFAWIKPDLSLEKIKKSMPSIEKNDKLRSSRVSFLNNCQNKI